MKRMHLTAALLAVLLAACRAAPRPGAHRGPGGNRRPDGCAHRGPDTRADAGPGRRADL